MVNIMSHHLKFILIWLTFTLLEMEIRPKCRAFIWCAKKKQGTESLVQVLKIKISQYATTELSWLSYNLSVDWIIVRFIYIYIYIYITHSNSLKKMRGKRETEQCKTFHDITNNEVRSIYTENNY
jgi:hypothetical protein